MSLCYYENVFLVRIFNYKKKYQFCFLDMKQGVNLKVYAGSAQL